MSLGVTHLTRMEKKRKNRMLAGGLSLLVGIAWTVMVPANSLALSVQGCELLIGTTCTLTPVQFYVSDVNGITDPALDSRIGTAFAKVGISVTANAAADFTYKYNIFDQQYTVTNFLLDLTLVPPPAILGAGYIPDANPSTISPLVASYDSVSGFFSAVFFAPSITTSVAGSDVLFVRSTLSPDDIAGTLGGSDFLDALLGRTSLQGPGSTLTASAQTPVPEPGTLILIGSGLLGLAARARKASA